MCELDFMTVCTCVFVMSAHKLLLSVFFFMLNVFNFLSLFTGWRESFPYNLFCMFYIVMIVTR